jgi:glycogen operon protein
MGVDGFRFDRASIFTRGDGSIGPDDPPIICDISGDPDLASVRLLVEPWPDRAGHGRFRATLRRFLKGDEGLVPELMAHLYGSADLWSDSKIEAFRRCQSINYIDRHGGFNMCDLVSYTSDDQHSWNCGHQGLHDVPDSVAVLRRQQVRNFCCLLMLSNGTPMFVAGDEFMQTQHGNPNPWDQNNETTWLDWELALENADILRFFQLMIAFRKAHPSIGRSTGWGADITWYGVDGAPDLARGSHTLAYHLRGYDVPDADIYVMINAYWHDLAFTVQAPGRWLRVVDTSLASPSEIVETAAAQAVRDARYTVAARSVVVLVSETPTHSQRSAAGSCASSVGLPVGDIGF